MFTAAEKLLIARSSIYNYLSDWSSTIDRDRLEDYLLDNDDFCNEVQRAETEDQINDIVSTYIDNLFDDGDITAFSNRDPWYNLH